MPYLTRHNAPPVTRVINISPHRDTTVGKWPDSYRSFGRKPAAELAGFLCSSGLLLVDHRQFYVLLPLAFVGDYLLFRKTRRADFSQEARAQHVISWCLAIIIVLSLIFSVWYTNYNAAQAYFVTPTRFWEFATGGALAMLPLATKIPERVQNLLGWAGIVMIALAGLIYTGETPFPGYTALLPVVGAALFIRYGSHQRRTGVYWWASLKPATRMGDWSYAIYLWHWPLIIIAGYQLESFTWPYKLGLIVLTFILSAASQRFIEDPLRHAKPFKVPTRAFGLMASNMALIAIVTFFLPQALVPQTQEEVSVSECVGADALLTDCQDPGIHGEPIISATQVQTEAEEPEYTECVAPENYDGGEPSGCSLGAPEDSADMTIAVVGDSHARAWLPMFEEIGEENNWNIQGYTKSGCTPVPLSSAEPDADQANKKTSDSCTKFIRDASDKFVNEDIDLVVTAASPVDRSFYNEDGETSEEIAVDALNDMWQEWKDAGKDVVVIGEVPHFEDVEGPTCVISNPEDIVDECSKPADEVIDGRQSILRSAAQAADTPVELYDPVPGICDDERCYSMVGQLITRYDHHHLSSDFARSFGDDFVSFVQERIKTSGS